ncbi:MAG: BspA family leucine-rich repeat surface protein [Prevotella sp.]|nr:BspA family leucine-rich repeat surface protein [Prevotella sp.]
MKRHFLRLSILVLVVVLGMVSCTDKDSITNDHAVEAVEQPDVPQPTDDQMTTVVTGELSAAVPSAFEEGSTGAALVNRLPQVTTGIGPDTRMVILKGSDFSLNTSTPTSNADYMEQVVNQYMNGGYICLMRPTAEQTALFMIAVLGSAIKLQETQFQEQFDISEAAAARALQSSDVVERLQNRAKIMQTVARRAADNDDSDEPIAELYILGPTDYFVQEPLLDEHISYAHSEDSEGNQSEPVAVSTKTERTPYVSGLLADAAAEWINNVELKNAENDLRNVASRASMRGEGTTAINEMMDASETLTYDGLISWRAWDHESNNRMDRVNMIVRSWGIHNMASNKDYYYIKQDVKLRMKDLFYPTKNEQSWFRASNYGIYGYWYGSFLSQYVTTMNLTGNGNISLEASSPNTDNASGTTSVSTGSSSSKTETAGISWGATLGLSPSVNFGGDYSLGYTTGTSFSLSSSADYTSLRVVKNTLDKTEVSWTYIGKLPEYYFDQQSKYYSHQTVADILVNDCDLSNQICWSVSNPSGQYTLNINSTPTTAALLLANLGNTHQYDYCTTSTQSYSHTLLEPNRAMQTWRMNITVDEWVDKPVAGAEGQLAKNIQEQFPVLYKPLFSVADKTPESLNTINYIIETSKNLFNENKTVLQALAHDLGIKRFFINWHCDDQRMSMRSSYMVDATEYMEGIPQVLWSAGNSTLYFVCASSILGDGSTWDGQNIRLLQYKKSVSNSPKTKVPSWHITGLFSPSDVTRVVIDESFAKARPTCCYAWFANFKNLKVVEGLEYLNTSEVTTMAYMFQNCESLVTLNVDGFDMSKVNNIQHMFDGCKSLTTIYCRQTWNVTVSGSMFLDCNNLVGAVGFINSYQKFGGSMANPKTGYFTMPPLVNVPDLYLKDNSQSNTSQLKQYEGQMVNIRYSRRLKATMNADGTYKPTPWTVCLPYDLDLSELRSSGQVDVYTLAAVENGQFVFKKRNVTRLTGGVPYVLMLKTKEFSLSAMNVRITATTPQKIPVYNSVASWQQGSGTVIGDWWGTFDFMDADEGAAFDAFVLQPSDQRWDYFDPDIASANIPAFRAFLSAPTIERKAYQARYQ